LKSCVRITRLKAFDGGREELNRRLHGFAWQNQQTGAAQTLAGLAGDARGNW